MKIWREGDRSRGICERCRRLVDTRFERREVALEQPPVKIPDVLVASCAHCGAIVAVPPQSSPRINEARSVGVTPIKVRITMEHDDLLSWMANEITTTPSRPLFDPLLKFYLGELHQRPDFASRVGHFAKAADLQGHSVKKKDLTIHLPESVLERALSKAAAMGIRNRSALFRALIAAMAEDIEKPERKRHVLLNFFPAIGSILTPSKG